MFETLFLTKEDLDKLSLDRLIKYRKKTLYTRYYSIRDRYNLTTDQWEILDIRFLSCRNYIDKKIKELTS